jgi:hypothetical protein
MKAEHDLGSPNPRSRITNEQTGTMTDEYSDELLNFFIHRPHPSENVRQRKKYAFLLVWLLVHGAWCSCC